MSRGERRNFFRHPSRAREDPSYPQAIVAPTGSPDERTNRLAASNPENPDPAQRSRIRRFGRRAMQIAVECVKKPIPSPADATRTRRKRVFAVPGGEPALADAGGVLRRALPGRLAKDPGAPRRPRGRDSALPRPPCRLDAGVPGGLQTAETGPARGGAPYRRPPQAPREAVRCCRACEEIGRRYKYSSFPRKRESGRGRPQCRPGFSHGNAAKRFPLSRE